MKQQYEEKMSTCSTLISHLQKLSLTTQLQSHGDGEEDQASAQASFTPPLERAPIKAKSDPAGSPGTFLRRRDREEMLIVPKASSLTRKRSKKEKRKGTPVVKVRLEERIIIHISKCFSSKKQLAICLCLQMCFFITLLVTCRCPSLFF